MQIYIWQDYDLAPRFPKLIKFLDFWSHNLEGPLAAIRVAQAGLVAPAHLSYVGTGAPALSFARQGHVLRVGTFPSCGDMLAASGRIFMRIFHRVSPRRGMIAASMLAALLLLPQASQAQDIGSFDPRYR